MMLIEEQMSQYFGLPELWRALSGMDGAQLVTITILFVIASFVFLTVVFRKQIEKQLNKKSEKKYSTYPWPSEEKIIIHHLPDKLAKTDKEAKEFKEMILHEIGFLRQENISGKQYLINMAPTVYMSEAIRRMFRELAEESIELNIVRLIYVIPKIKKGKSSTQQEIYYKDIKELCEKRNRPGSFAVKEKRFKLFK